MKHNLKAEMKQSMDALHFSQEEKNAMLYDLTAQMQQVKSRRHGGRKLMAVALAAAMVLVTLTGAAVFTRWSTTAQNQYKVVQTQSYGPEARGGASASAVIISDEPIHYPKVTEPETDRKSVV